MIAQPQVLDLTDALHSRQSLTMPTEVRELNVEIVGCGTIGSNAALYLLKSGVTNFTFYDPDVVALENLYPQWFRREHVGMPKVEALEAQCREFYGNYDGMPTLNITSHQAKFNPVSRTPRDIFVVGVDNMAARRAFWNNKLFSYNLWLDGRIGGREAMVYAVTPADDEKQALYADTLTHGDVEEQCGAKSTAYIGGLVAARMVYSVNQYLRELQPTYYWQHSGEHDLTFQS